MLPLYSSDGYGLSPSDLLIDTVSRFLSHEIGHARTSELITSWEKKGIPFASIGFQKLRPVARQEVAGLLYEMEGTKHPRLFLHDIFENTYPVEEAHWSSANFLRDEYLKRLDFYGRMGLRQDTTMVHNKPGYQNFMLNVLTDEEVRKATSAIREDFFGDFTYIVRQIPPVVIREMNKMFTENRAMNSNLNQAMRQLSYEEQVKRAVDFRIERATKFRGERFLYDDINPELYSGQRRMDFNKPAIINMLQSLLTSNSYFTANYLDKYFQERGQNPHIAGFEKIMNLGVMPSRTDVELALLRYFSNGFLSSANYETSFGLIKFFAKHGEGKMNKVPDDFRSNSRGDIARSGKISAIRDYYHADGSSTGHKLYLLVHQQKLFHVLKFLKENNFIYKISGDHFPIVDVDVYCSSWKNVNEISEYLAKHLFHFLINPEIPQAYPKDYDHLRQAILLPSGLLTRFTVNDRRPEFPEFAWYGGKYGLPRVTKDKKVITDPVEVFKYVHGKFGEYFYPLDYVQIGHRFISAIPAQSTTVQAMKAVMEAIKKEVFGRTGELPFDRYYMVNRPLTREEDRNKRMKDKFTNDREYPFMTIRLFRTDEAHPWASFYEENRFGDISRFKLRSRVKCPFTQVLYSREQYPKGEMGWIYDDRKNKWPDRLKLVKFRDNIPKDVQILGLFRKKGGKDDGITYTPAGPDSSPQNRFDYEMAQAYLEPGEGLYVYESSRAVLDQKGKFINEPYSHTNGDAVWDIIDLRKERKNIIATIERLRLRLNVRMGQDELLNIYRKALMLQKIFVGLTGTEDRRLYADIYGWIKLLRTLLSKLNLNLYLTSEQDVINSSIEELKIVPAERTEKQEKEWHNFKPVRVELKRDDMRFSAGVGYGFLGDKNVDTRDSIALRISRSTQGFKIDGAILPKKSWTFLQYKGNLLHAVDYIAQDVGEYCLLSEAVRFSSHPGLKRKVRLREDSQQPKDFVVYVMRNADGSITIEDSGHKRQFHFKPGEVKTFGYLLVKAETNDVLIANTEEKKNFSILPSFVSDLEEAENRAHVALSVNVNTAMNALGKTAPDVGKGLSAAVSSVVEELKKSVKFDESKEPRDPRSNEVAKEYLRNHPGIIDKFVQAMNKSENPLIDNISTDYYFNQLIALLWYSERKSVIDVWDRIALDKARVRYPLGIDPQSKRLNEQYAVRESELNLPSKIVLKEGYYLRLDGEGDNEILFSYRKEGKLNSIGRLALVWNKHASSWTFSFAGHYLFDRNDRGKGLGQLAITKLVEYLGSISSSGIDARRTSPFAQRMWQRMRASIEYFGFFETAREKKDPCSYVYVIRSANAKTNSSSPKKPLFDQSNPFKSEPIYEGHPKRFHIQLSSGEAIFEFTRRGKERVSIDRISSIGSKRIHYTDINYFNSPVTVTPNGVDVICKLNKMGQIEMYGKYGPVSIKNDKAMSIGPNQMKRQNERGGIDLTAEHMNLEVDKDKAQISQMIDLKELENIEINGLYIKDIEIKSLKNLSEVLGIH